MLGFSQGGPTACRWLSSSDLNFDSQDLAQAQQETIADLGDEDEAELQAVIAAQREQQRIKEERLRKQREEEQRLAQLEEERKRKEDEEQQRAEELAEQSKQDAMELEQKRAEEERRKAELAAKESEEQARAEKERKEQQAAEEARRLAQKKADERRKEEERESIAKTQDKKVKEKRVDDAPWIEEAAQKKLDEITRMKEDESDVIVFRNIHFDFDKSDLRPLSEAELNKIYQFMVDNPDYELQLDGHTDWIGTVEYNLELSERRAKQAYSYLVTKGIDEGRMNYQFFGEAIPITPNAKQDGSDDPVGRQLNRRCEFEVKESGTATNISLKF